MDFKTAADAIKQLANRYESMVEVAAVLDSISSIDNAKNEAIRDKDAAIEARAEAVMQLGNVQGQIAAAKDQARLIVEGAEKSASEILAAAKDEGELAIAAGKTQAQAIIAKASNDNLVALSMVKSNVESATKKLEELNAELASKQTVLDQVNAELADSQEKHAQAKAAIAKILG